MPATTTSGQPPATPEEIWAILRESAKELEEIKAIIKVSAEIEAKHREAEAKHKEAEAKHKEEEAKIRKEAALKEAKYKEAEAKIREEAALKEAKIREEAALKEAKYKEDMKELDKKIGWLNNRFGEVVEHLVAPGILDKFNEMGLKLTSVAENRKLKNAETRQAITEVDVMLESPDTVIAVSVKSKANDDDINEHIQQMEKLRQFADSQNDKRSYFGGIASAVTSDSLRSRILKAGFYAVEQAGDTMCINVPEGFKPRKW